LMFSGGKDFLKSWGACEESAKSKRDLNSHKKKKSHLPPGKKGLEKGWGYPRERDLCEKGVARKTPKTKKGSP